MNIQPALMEKRITISVLTDIRDDLNFLTEALNINRSSLIRQLILDWMISRKNVFQEKNSTPSSNEMNIALQADD